MKKQDVPDHREVLQDGNKKIIDRYVAAFNSGDMTGLNSLFAEDAVVQGVFGMVPVKKAFDVWEQLVTGLNMKLIIEEVIEEGEQIAVRYSEKGTFSGVFMGNAPTGKSYEIKAMEWFVIKNGKIQQRWGARDHASQARQIGLPLL